MRPASGRGLPSPRRGGPARRLGGLPRVCELRGFRAEGQCHISYGYPKGSLLRPALPERKLFLGAGINFAVSGQIPPPLPLVRVLWHSSGCQKGNSQCVSEFYEYILQKLDRYPQYECLLTWIDL